MQSDIIQNERKQMPKRFCTDSGWEKSKRWLKAVAKWTADGCPVRNDLEIETYYEICHGTEGESEPCRFFSKEGSCKLCGCKLSKSRIAFLNKIRMATESCPKGYWPYD